MAFCRLVVTLLGSDCTLETLLKIQEVIYHGHLE